MFAKRVQPWQLGFTDFEMEILLKIMDGEDLTSAEERRADKMQQTMKTQYERLRVKRSGDYAQERYDEHDRSDDRHLPAPRGDRKLYQVPDEAIAAKPAPKQLPAPKAAKPPRGRRAVRTS